MARVNNDITIMLSEEEKEILTKAIKICEQISDDTMYSVGWIFSELVSDYESGKLHTYIYF